MKRLFLAGACALFANLAVAAPAEAPILPGYWKWSAKVLLGLAQVDGGRRCLKESEIEEFVAFPGNRHYRCTYPTKEIGGGKLTMQGVCVDKKGRRAPIRANGTYTPENFKLNVRLTTTNGIPVAGVMTAQRVSAQCPAGA
jgi:hypothetical protein